MKPAHEKIEEQLEHGVLADINTHISENTGSRSNFAEERVVPFIKSLIIEELEGLLGEEKEVENPLSKDIEIVRRVNAYNKATKKHNTRIQNRIKEYKNI